MLRHPERWGSLGARYELEKPRKLLALDGGGIRGLITLGILQEMESMLKQRERAGDSFRLCDYFDYIAGTSTGAIIAAGLARGMSVSQLIDFYRSAGAAMFEKTHILKRFNSLYKADPLRAKLREVYGDGDLSPDNLKCLLLMVTRNVTTDSPWPISTNPEAKYNNPERPDCNLRIPLWHIVRASTAAPVYFPPETLQWDKNDPSKTFVFVDGGMTPYNNPAFLLFRMATAKPYRLEWKTGERNLLVVSVGTGGSSSPDERTNFNILTSVTGLPKALMYGMQVDQDINCRTVGRCTYAEFVDSELFDMTCRTGECIDDWKEWLNTPEVPLSQDLGRAFLYARYNADLSRKGLDELGCGDLKPEAVQKLDSVAHIDDLLRVGRAAGKSVKPEHFGPFAG